MVRRLAEGLVAEFGWLAGNSLAGGLGSTGPWLEEALAWLALELVRVVRC